MVGLWLRWKPCAGNTCAEHDLNTTKITATADGSELKEVSGMAKGEFSCFKSVFFEAIRFGNNKINY